MIDPVNDAAFAVECMLDYFEATVVSEFDVTAESMRDQVGILNQPGCSRVDEQRHLGNVVEPPERVTRTSKFH